MVFSLLISLCGVIIALFGVLKAYLEYAVTKTKTKKTNENGVSDKPRS